MNIRYPIYEGVYRILTNYKSLIISVFIKTVVYYVKLEWILYNIIV